MVFMSPVKEPNFYIAARNFGKGFDWYRSLFTDAPHGALLGEASTNYSKGTTFPGVPELVRTHAPNVRLIYLIRDPLERIRSHYTHAVFHGREKRPVSEAIAPRSGFVRTSLYGAELQRWREYFPADQLLVLLTEDLRDDPTGVLRRAERFLGLEPHDYRHLDRQYHVSSRRPVKSRTGELLERNQRLEALSRWVVPEAIRERLVTKPAGSGGEPIPDAVLDRIREILDADRQLLLSQVDVDLGKWIPLNAQVAR